MELDTRHLVRIQCRRQRVLIDLVALAQQFTLITVGVAEQQDLGTFALGAAQRALIELKADHQTWPWRLSSRRRTNSSSTREYKSSCK